MDTRLIAKILPTKKNGKQGVGTGYPIAKDLVLTARHVVIFPDRDENKPIVIEWTDYNHNDDNVTEIVFDGGKECDIAILRCKIPPQVQVSPSILARRFPKSSEKWEGFGYPKIGKNEETETRKKIPVKGEFFSPDATNHEIFLEVDAKSREDSGWCGISGASVFQENLLYAVITSMPTTRDNCFKAVSIPHLLKYNEKFCEAIKQPNNEEEKIKQKQALHNKVKSEITLILKKWCITTDELIDDLRLLPPDNETRDHIVKHLVDDNTVIDSIIKLTQVLEEHKDSLISDTNQWNKCVKAAEEICGWLLIKSVNNDWWFDHEQEVNKKIVHKLTLDEPAYIEIIISRSFLQLARYKVDSKSGKARPKLWNEDDDDKPRKENEPPRMFDATNNAVKEEWLRSIYKDLHGQNTNFIPIDNNDFTTEILKSIKSRARSKYDVRKKIIYYLVPSDYFQQLELAGWVNDCQEYLAGYLQFICCDKKTQPNQEHSIEDQTRLLEQLAVLLNMKI